MATSPAPRDGTGRFHGKVFRKGRLCRGQPPKARVRSPIAHATERASCIAAILARSPSRWAGQLLQIYSGTHFSSGCGSPLSRCFMLRPGLRYPLLLAWTPFRSRLHAYGLVLSVLWHFHRLARIALTGSDTSSNVLFVCLQHHCPTAPTSSPFPWARRAARDGQNDRCAVHLHRSAATNPGRQRRLHLPLVFWQLRAARLPSSSSSS